MSARIAVRVHPGARRRGITGRLANGEWKVSVQVPAEGGRANEAVLEVLAAALSLRPRQLAVVRGAGSRSKVIEVAGVVAAEVERRLAAGTEPDDE